MSFNFQGEPGNEFFLILKGEVSVFVPNGSENKNLDPMVKRMKSEAFDVYSQYMAKNMQRIEQETHSATHKKEVFLQRTYSHKKIHEK